jgi:hypothetical protein
MAYPFERTLRSLNGYESGTSPAGGEAMGRGRADHHQEEGGCDVPDEDMRPPRDRTAAAVLFYAP